MDICKRRRTKKFAYSSSLQNTFNDKLAHSLPETNLNNNVRTIMKSENIL